MTAQEFKKIRRKIQRSQVELAKELRISPQAVKFYETDRRPVPGPVAKLMEIFSKRECVFWSYKFDKFNI